MTYYTSTMHKKISVFLYKLFTEETQNSFSDERISFFNIKHYTFYYNIIFGYIYTLYKCFHKG